MLKNFSIIKFANEEGYLWRMVRGAENSAEDDDDVT
jgi:hypothetical protein